MVADGSGCAQREVLAAPAGVDDALLRANVTGRFPQPALGSRDLAAHHLPPQISNIAWRASAPVYADGAQVGYATSGCWSPLLKKMLALAHLKQPHFAPGTQVEMEVTVEHQRKRAAAVVRALPFFDPERKNA